MATTSNTAQRDYIKTQVEAFIQRIGETGSWNKEEALSELGDWIDSATFKVPRKTRVATVVEAGNRCVARVWAGGDGGQCKKAKNGDGDFCRNCSKKNTCCSTPASFNMDGSHKGLFWGRVDEELPIDSADGKGIAIMWKDEDVREEIREKLEGGGAWHPFCTNRPRRTGDWEATPITEMTAKKSKSKKSKSNSKRTKNAYLFFMDKTRAEITSNLRIFIETTEMVPEMGIYFLAKKKNDLKAALTAFKKLKKNKKLMKTKMTSLEIKGDGAVADDFVFKGKYAMGPIGKLGGALWKSMDEDEKSPFQELAAAAKAEMAAASDAESDTVMSDLELEKSDMEDADDEEEEEGTAAEEITLADGTTIWVGEKDNLIYDEDGEDIGTYDRKTKMAKYYDADDSGDESEEDDEE